MRNLVLTIAEPRQWDAYYSIQGSADMLFCPTGETITVGEVVRIKVSFMGGPQFFLTGVVVWRRAAGTTGRRLRPGVGVRLNESERSKVGYIRGFARGGLIDKRRAPRLPLRLRVTYRASSARRVNFTRNLTQSGILLSAAELLPVNTPVELSLALPVDDSRVRLVGTVVRHVEDDRGRAMGIRLDFESEAESRRFAGLVRDLERAFNTGKLEEAYIDK
jgi:Tfp pilus assembly protein PilZ